MATLCRFQPLEFSTDAMGAPASPEPLYGELEAEIVWELLGNPLTETIRGDRAWPLKAVRLRAPVLPTKIVCVARNFHGHIAEFGGPAPAFPDIFLKPPSSMIGPEDPIVLPPAAQRVDYEAELGVVIGRKCSQLGETADVQAYILGYVCLNDVTARDLQRSDAQWTRAKSFDTFCPIGPVIQTGLDLAEATIETCVNSGRRQFARVSDMIFPVDFIIRWISHAMTLMPGDVIATGTPAGTGPMSAGDVVEVIVSGIGRLRNPVMGAPAAQRFVANA